MRELIELGFKRVTKGSAFILIVLLLASSNIVHASYQPPHNQPGPAVDRLRFKAFHVDVAPASIKAGEMDLYIYGLKVAAARALLDDPTVKICQAPATTLSIILNPAPAPQGQLNPLSIREVRSALQYLIDRETVSKVIYKGMAAPMTTHVTPLDYDYLTIYDLVKQYNIRYDPDVAREMINDAMTGAGAALKDGRWYYNERPVELKFVIRVEDERREVGDLIRAKMDELGFSVIPIYQTFGPAIFTVYGTDPQLFMWHIYTEGWSRAAVEKYDYSTINQMCAPWLGNMPGWQEVGFWQYRQHELDQLGQRIFTGSFRNLQERNDLYRKVTELSLKESVRIWIAAVMNSFPAVGNLEGVTEDVVSGPRAIWTLREAHVPGRNDLTVGNLWVWTERTTWNPVGGFRDAYSIDIWRNMYDPPLWRHPFTGVPMPFRVNYEVQTAGPTGKLAVPEDAVIWDADSDRWVGVGKGVEATSRVTFDYKAYLTSKWHHGEPITLADIVYSMYQSFEMVYDKEKSKIEPAIAVTARPYLDTFKGLRISGSKVEVYVNFWHFEEDYIAEYASLAGLSMPWEILAAMDEIVFSERKAAYTDTAAERFNVPWLNLVMDTDARLVVKTLDRFVREEYTPEKALTVGGRLLADREEARRRYDAAKLWFREYGVLVISNGPFKLVRFDAPAQYAELEAFRDPTYPFKPGKWYYGRAEMVEIVEIAGRTIGIGYESEINIRLKGPGELGLRYVLFDLVGGNIVQMGDADRVSPTEFIISLPPEVTSTLKAGPYKLFLAAYSDKISIIDEREEIVEAVKGPPRTTGTRVIEIPEAGLPRGEPTTILLAAIATAAAASVVVIFGLRRMMRKGSKIS